jgi:hypothetical protein
MFGRWPMHYRVLVSLIDGTAIDGLLIDKRGQLLILADCTLYADGAEPTAMDGEVYVERSRVLYLQKPRGE